MARTATGAAIKMLDQVGPLATDERGISTRGVLIRHLVLPGGLGGTRRVMEFIRNELGRNVPVSLMCQYFPAHKASDHDLLSRGITSLEWEEAVECIHAARLEVGWIQDPEFVGHSSFTMVSPCGTAKTLSSLARPAFCTSRFAFSSGTPALF